MGYIEDSRINKHEDQYGKGVEARGDKRIEDTPERENSYWLAKLGITPERVEEARSYRLYAGGYNPQRPRSTAYVITELMQARLADPINTDEEFVKARARLKHLSTVFTYTAYSLMNGSGEQDAIGQTLQSSSFSVEELKEKLTPDMALDLLHLWREFELPLPQDVVGKTILAKAGRILKKS